MPTLPPGKAQFNIVLDVDVAVEVDALCADYHLEKGALGEALLRLALHDDHVENAVQQAKDTGDRRMRARRKSRLEQQGAAHDGPSEVAKLPLRRRESG